MLKKIAMVLILGCAACGAKTDNLEIIARVNNSLLYKSDLLKVLPEIITVQDSSLFAQNYINEWALKQLLLQKAGINLAEESEDIDKLVNKYKQDLLINKYKEAVVKQELDTLVTDSHINEFFTNNRNIFKLNEELIKFRYISFGNQLNNKKDLIQMFKENDSLSNALIAEQELQFQALHLNDSIWIKYDDIKKNKDIFENFSKTEFLTKNKTFQKEDDNDTYIVQIKDVLLRNDIAPISYAKPTIIQMILHQRKLNLLQKIEETLTEDAIKNKEFQIY